MCSADSGADVSVLGGSSLVNGTTRKFRLGKLHGLCSRSACASESLYTPRGLRAYKASLAAAWREHLESKGENAPTVISLFAGAGGSSLGYSMAGFRELLSVEWNAEAASTFRHNLPGVPVYEIDIANLSVEEALRRTELRCGELDVLDGSPPCQGFSTAGRWQIEDSRNELFREFVRLLEGLQPRAFVMENVSGMVQGKMKLIFAEIIQALRGCGYRVSARLMNTMYFGVPQSRRRLIFVGVRADLDSGSSTSLHPHAQSLPIVFADACWDLRGNRQGDRMLSNVVSECGKYQPAKWGTDEAIYERYKGNRASAPGLQWAGWDRVCGTIVKSEISFSGIVHPDRERYLSLAEAKRIGAFPDEFVFEGGRSIGIAQIGNSVPPLFMRAIALYIRREILLSDE